MNPIPPRRGGWGEGPARRIPCRSSVPSKTVSNVWYGFGHSHMGLTWGPTTGRLISELMTGVRSNIDLAPFRVDRF